MKKIEGELEKCRATKQELESYGHPGDTHNGIFVLRRNGQRLFVVASSGGGWEHVSVSLKNRIPTWREMCYVKNLFFHEEETVVQYHPSKSEYINLCDTCLHLWRPTNLELPTPPTFMV